MPGPILHEGAIVTCTHGGMATLTVPNPNVLLAGMPAASIAGPWAVAGCAFVPPAGNGPCVTGMFVVGAVQVLINGAPAAIMPAPSVCVPTGTPLLPITAQMQVIAT
jgi:uncharacterized Zn-binding protein involved in type VI secretion